MPSAHLDTEQVQRMLHGELAAEDVASVHAHLAACAACRQRVAEADAEEAAVHALLRHVDHAPPAVDAAAVVATARRRRPARLRWAAGIVLALGAAGAVYAVPGSPLRGLVEAVRDRVGERASPATVETPARQPGPDVAGIAVPAGERLVIAFTAPQQEGRATVSLTDAAEVVIRARSGTATFTSGVDRLVIDNEGSTASFDIEIPRGAPQVEILVAGRRVFVKEGSRITAETSNDSVGPYHLPLARR